METNEFLRKLSQSRGPLLFLGAALAASSLLAYLAIASERAHRRAVNETLRNLTSIAAWEADRAVTQDLQHALNMTLWPASQLGVVGETPPPPTILAGESQQMDCDCPMPLAARFYFQLDLASGDFVSAGEMPPDTFAIAVGDLLREHGGRRNQPGWRGMLIGVTLGRDRYLTAVTVLPDRTGAPDMAYGAVVGPAALTPVIETALRTAVILPPPVSRGHPYDSLFVVTVDGPDGSNVFRSGETSTAGVVESANLGFLLGDLQLHVALRTNRGGWLALTPNSRTHLLWALLAAVLVFFALAFVQLHRRQELLALQNRFISGVSHELRTPLTQIRLFSQTLRMGRERSESERQQFLDFLDEDAHRLGNLVENILRFQRIQGGRDEVTPEPMNVDVLVEEVARAFEPLAATRGTKLEVVSDPDLTILGDQAAMHQVLLNLLDNAVKYGPEGQTVRILAGRSGESVRISISDEGPGVPPADRKRIFQPFARLDRRAERAAGGTGIGLAVVRDLIERLQGRIRVDDASTRDDGGARGAVFILEFADAGRGAGPRARTDATDIGQTGSTVNVT